VRRDSRSKRFCRYIYYEENNDSGRSAYCDLRVAGGAELPGLGSGQQLAAATKVEQKVSVRLADARAKATTQVAQKEAR